MDLKKFQMYYYYGTGADEINVQREVSFYIDTYFYNDIFARNDSGDDVIYQWEDLNVTVKEAVSMVNSKLGFKAVGNDIKYYFSNPETDALTPSQLNAAVSFMSAFGINGNQIRQITGDRNQTETKRVFLNGEMPNSVLSLPQYVNFWDTPDSGGMTWRLMNIGDAGNVQLYMYSSDPTEYTLRFNAVVLPDDYFLSDSVNDKYSSTREASFNIDFVGRRLYIFPFTPQNVEKIIIRCSLGPSLVYPFFSDVTLIGTLPQEEDLSNPYGPGGTSGPGGGNGTLKPGSLDSIDPAEIPDLPGISAANLGFITMYNPSVTQLKALSDFMWSGAFDIATYKKLFSDPMQSIIGLSIVPVAPTIAGSKNVHFGSIDSGVNMPYLSTNYVRLDCGWCDVERYIGCFMDNEPYTKISIYLPFIGIRQISADDVIGGSIHVVYNIDVLTGACACFIEHNSRGVLYSYNGSCITNVPLTAVNFSGAIQNAVSAIGSAVGMVAGMATGAAPVAAMGAVGLLTSAANTALNSKPQVQRSGNLGGSAGIMSIMTPYVIIERPDVSVPNRVQHYVGQTSNITMSLGACRGFTLCEYVHIDNVSATTEEIAEIESLLKQGVIL